MEREDYLANEQDMLRGLLEAAEDRTQDVLPIEIARKGKTYFRFRIRPLTEREYNICRDKATKYQRSRQLGGLKLPEETDTTRYRSLLIYEATVEEDRKRLWDNKEAWSRLNVLNGPDLIDAVLMAGEKDAIVAKIDEISGYDVDLEETAKN
jgi:hypothetical protein